MLKACKIKIKGAQRKGEEWKGGGEGGREERYNNKMEIYLTKNEVDMKLYINPLQSSETHDRLQTKYNKYESDLWQALWVKSLCL